MTWRIYLLFIVPLPGCSGPDAGGYESTAIYPPRTDAIVISTVKAAPPTALHANGMLDESIDALAARGAEIISPSSVESSRHKTIADSLVELFGTPSAPRIDHPDAAAHGLNAERLASGSRVYKLHCVQCHGMTGDGRGPTSLWVYPHARDFRQGQFKYVSTASGLGWPTRADLHRVIRRGLGGSSMPPFALLSDGDIDDAASYTLHLMLRGFVEFDLIRDDDADARTRLNNRFAAWKQAQSSELDVSEVPALEPKSAEGDAVYSDAVRRGHAVFRSDKAACLSCHADYGRGSVFRYDVWGVAVKPSNLVESLPRGGGTAADLVRRLKCGIAGSGMPAASQLSENETNDLVLFLRALPDPKHLPGEVRSTVYPEAR